MCFSERKKEEEIGGEVARRGISEKFSCFVGFRLRLFAGCVARLSGVAVGERTAGDQRTNLTAQHFQGSENLTK